MADHVQSLAQLEILCKQLYETTETGVRLQAEKALVEFTNSPDCLSKCQLLLERGSSSYSQLLAATCLSKLVSRTSNPLPLEHRIDIRNYVLNYLATRPKLAEFVTQALIQLYSRITKLGWFDCQKDDYVFRNVIADVTRFLQDSVEHCIIGVTILSQLTNEINQADTSHPLTKHRKIASSFRDSSLFDIFTLSCNLLKQVKRLSLLYVNLFILCVFQHWEFAPNSVHYLLSLWQRLAASVPYVKATEPHLLETYTPEVTKAYITSRLESVCIILRDGLEDPLDDAGLVQQQLDQLSTIGRCEYEKTCALLVQLFDQSAQTYQELLQSTNSSTIDITVQEGRLTWLVYIIGAVIGGRVSFASTDEQDAMDGELVCRVLQLMNLTDSRLAQAGNERLELAMLSFFEQFRKIYIGDQVQKSSKLYRRLSEVLGLNDETMVLSVFIGKIITNLKYWGQCEPITSKTLQLLNDLSIGYPLPSVRKLVKLSAVQFMLNNHTSEHFSFLGVNNQSNLSDMRCRTTFYTALGRLLMVDLGEDEDQFEQFMLPLTAAFEAVAQMFSTNTFNEQEAKRTLVGLVRDLRGIAFAFNAKTSFMMLFDWIYPAYMPILQRAIELWYHVPACTTPVLKLMAELVHNRSQRLQFDVSSPNGILLFRETSKMITTYGKTFKCLIDYPKLSQSFYSLLEVLTQDHMNFIASLEPHVVMYILSSISEGLTALDTMVCTGCCSSLDHIVTYLFKQLSRSTKKRPAAMATDDRFLHIMQQHPEMIQQMLSTVLNIIIFEDCRNQWSMSRPLLGLILLNEKYFADLRNSIVNSQPPEKQQAMHLCFENLMEGIERNLLTKNRDRFTQNLSVFRREVNDSMKNSSYGVNSNDMMS
uniref:Exportin 7 n=1 Tax=Oncorhynchus mykiss TaxID=8022 RepID=A0A8C7V2V1_ONCMY